MKKNDTYLKIYQYIIDHYKQHGCAPTFREIAQGCGIQSTCTVHRYIHLMEEDGTIEMNGNRTIRPSGMSVEIKFHDPQK